MATTVSDWLNQGQEHTLPSGKVVRLRDVDVLSILTEGGEVPNFLLKQMNTKTVKAAQDVEVSAQDMLKIAPLLDKLAIGMFIEPRVSTNADEVERGEAIAPHHIGLQDKLKLIEIGMGELQRFRTLTDFLKHKLQVWVLYNRTQKLGLKPSDEVGIRNLWLAWQFDECVYIFGLQVEGELAQCKDAAQRSIKLHEMLGIERAQKKLNLAARMAMGGVKIR